MILCIGATPTVQRTLVFARLQLDEVNRAASVDDFASGKSVNVARVAKLIGADVIASGFVGGMRGRFLREQLSADGVPHDFVVTASPTRLCTTLIDQHTDAVTELVEESSPVSKDDWRKLLGKCTRWLGKAKVCVLSGSLPPGGDLGFYADVIAAATSRGVKVVLDTRGKPLEHALRHPGFIAKLNRQELSETVGRRLSSDASLKKAMREVCPVDGEIIITMGKSGAVAFDGETFWQIPTPTVQAVNPIGSGDAFAAGLGVGLMQQLPPAKRYALASACGAANALHPRAGFVDPAVVKRLARQLAR